MFFFAHLLYKSNFSDGFPPTVFLHACRALAVSAVITGFFGGVLTLIGMKCTKIGGTEVINARVTFSGGVTYLVSGKKCWNKKAGWGWGGFQAWCRWYSRNNNDVVLQGSVAWSPTPGGPTESCQSLWIQTSRHKSASRTELTSPQVMFECVKVILCPPLNFSDLKSELQFSLAGEAPFFSFVEARFWFTSLGKKALNPGDSESVFYTILTLCSSKEKKNIFE